MDESLELTQDEKRLEELKQKAQSGQRISDEKGAQKIASTKLPPPINE